ncbi:MAG: DUF4426 domain-containing protein [Xanthomonadales bacterium]
MKRIPSLLGLLAIILLAPAVQAQQSQDFGDYVVHYSAFNAHLITPEIARAYDIQRSSSRAVLNITVLKKVMDTPGTPVRATVKAEATNLTGQRREIAMREIDEPGGAVYHLGEFPVHNMETWRFQVDVKVEGEDEPLQVRFKQQFYTE